MKSYASSERVISRNPNHPGACHYYIHAVEAVNPQAAVPCAERLARLMPGEGHMVHMPAHIYIRVGRWNDAVQANQHAIHTDEVFIEGQHPMGVYPLAYYPHNIHFLAFASTMAGRSAQAIEASNTLTSKVNLDAARQVGLLAGNAAVPRAHAHDVRKMGRRACRTASAGGHPLLVRHGVLRRAAWRTPPRDSGRRRKPRSTR